MSAVGVAAFIAEVSLHFPRPKYGEDAEMQAAWVSSINETLSGYDDEILHEAARRIRTTRTKKDGAFFPLPAECKDICSAVAAEFTKTQKPLLPPTNTNEWSDERINLAFDLCRTELGQRAAREGWVKTLHDFCRKNARAPKGPEVDECIRDARLTDKIIDELRSEQNPTPITGALLKFADTVLERRKEIAEKIIGGKA